MQTSMQPSYDSGTSAQPLIGRTIGDYFDTACAEHAQREAQIGRASCRERV